MWGVYSLLWYTIYIYIHIYIYMCVCVICRRIVVDKIFKRGRTHLFARSFNYCYLIHRWNTSKTMKGYPTFPTAPGLEPHDQRVYFHIKGTRYEMQSVYSITLADQTKSYMGSIQGCQFLFWTNHGSSTQQNSSCVAT